MSSDNRMQANPELAYPEKLLLQKFAASLNDILEAQGYRVSSFKRPSSEKSMIASENVHCPEAIYTHSEKKNNRVTVLLTKNGIQSTFEKYSSRKNVPTKFYLDFIQRGRYGSLELSHVEKPDSPKAMPCQPAQKVEEFDAAKLETVVKACMRATEKTLEKVSLQIW